MSAAIPQFTYRSPNRIDFSTDESEDESSKPAERYVLRHPLAPRVQVGQITQSKDKLKDWLALTWRQKPLPVRWAEQVHSAWPVARYVSTSGQLSALAHVFYVLLKSRQILELKDDWDGQGSPGYTKMVWERAYKFVMHSAIEALKGYSVVIQAPKILPGPDGSIDIHWKTDTRELLVNIPKSSNELAQFYGDDYGSLQIKGTIDPDNPSSALLMWLPMNR